MLINAHELFHKLHITGGDSAIKAIFIALDLHRNYILRAADREPEQALFLSPCTVIGILRATAREIEQALFDF